MNRRGPDQSDQPRSLWARTLQRYGRLSCSLPWGTVIERPGGFARYASAPEPSSVTRTSKSVAVGEPVHCKVGVRVVVQPTGATGTGVAGRVPQYGVKVRTFDSADCRLPRAARTAHR